MGNLTNYMCMGWECGREGTAARTVVLKLQQSANSGIQCVGLPRMTLTDLTSPLMNFTLCEHAQRG